MNKVLIGIIAFAVISGGVVAFVNSGNESTNSANSPQSTSTEQVDGTGLDSQDSDEIKLAPIGSGEVVAYSAEALASSDTAYNLLFFHAGWCIVCNSVEQNLEAASIPDDLTIFKVDYDSTEGQALADKYRIPIQYTMVQVDTSGNEITQWVNQRNDGIQEISDRLQSS